MGRGEEGGGGCWVIGGMTHCHFISYFFLLGEIARMKLFDLVNSLYAELQEKCSSLESKLLVFSFGTQIV